MFAPRWFQGFWNEHWKLVCMISEKDISGLCSSSSPPQSPQRSQVWWGWVLKWDSRHEWMGGFWGWRILGLQPSPWGGQVAGTCWLLPGPSLTHSSLELTRVRLLFQGYSGEPPGAESAILRVQLAGGEIGAWARGNGAAQSPSSAVMQSDLTTVSPANPWASASPVGTGEGPQTSHRKASDFCREMLAGSFIN